MTETTPVTVLGLGVMGTALAEAFLRNGHPTTVWNRTASRAEPLVKAGATATASPAEAIAASPLVIVCVVHNDVFREVLTPLAGKLAGKTLVNLDNGTPAQAREFAGWAAEHGIDYLDGGIMAIPPMIGTPAASVFYSGSPAAFETHRETLARLGQPRFFGDDPGLAALYDVALLTGMYGVFAGFLQAVSVVRSTGATATEFLPLVMPWLEAMLPSLAHAAAQIDGDYGEGVTSPLAMQAAAFDNLLDTARDAGVRPDLFVPLAELMREAVSAGHGEHDVSSLVEVLRIEPAATG